MHAGTQIAHYLDYLRHLKFYLAFLMFCVTSLLSWSIIFKVGTTGSIDNWKVIVYTIWLNLVFASLVWAIEKLVLQVFSVQFHKRAYQERMEQNKKAYVILEKLNKARKNKKNNPNSKYNTLMDDSVFSSTQDHQDETDHDNTPAFSDKPSKSPGAAVHLREIGTKAADVSINIAKGLGQVFGAAVGIELGYSTGVVLRTPQDARTLAKKLFQALCRRPDDLLVPEDLDPYFTTLEESRYAFAFFDKDNNGDISKQEMKAAVLEIYRERMAIEKSLRSSSQAIGKLDNLLKAVVYVIVLFISLGIWNVNTATFLTAAISLWAGLLFAGLFHHFIVSLLAPLAD